jgi:hypothetical protein
MDDWQPTPFLGTSPVGVGRLLVELAHSVHIRRVKAGLVRVLQLVAT